jgi:GT2 family glycosyltransferase/glycosyltransferase involved in cell wall biosynthesis
MAAGADESEVQAKSSRTDVLAWRLRHWASLLARARASLRRRGLLSTLRTAWRHLRPPARTRRALEIPEDAPGRLPVLPAVAAMPRASIVIPVHGQLEATLRCLRALAASGDAAAFELIVVDDASPDDTPRVLADLEGLRFLRLPSNQGFIAACNAGAELARGEFVVLLNNDTLPQPGWLDALLATFDAHPDTGVAGAMLLYPDGRLQEAGGIVHADGEAANYGRGEDPDDPRFGFVREADYVSGAALAIPRALWHRLGGLDAHFAPAYYEDTDLGMRVRGAGLRVRYQPEARVVHLEGASAGTDPSRGMKAWQPVNQRRFAARWARELQAQPSPRLEPAQAANHRASPRILWLEERAPRPDRDSGSARAVALMRLLLDRGCALDFATPRLQHEGEATPALQQLGVCAWWREDGDFAAWLQAHGPGYDAIVVSRHHLLAPLLPLLRKRAPRAQLVFDTVDLHFLREQREAERLDDDPARQAAARTQAKELALLSAVDLSWVVSPVERELLATLAPGARVELLSNVHAPVAATPGFAARAGFVFVGGFLHAPNVDAVLWLASEIWPRLRAALPAATLHLVGAEPPAAVRALAGTPGLQLHGHVPALEALLDGCRASLAPLRFGAGVKGKVNQALARGLPVVATHCAAEGMQLVDGEDVLLADAAADFVSKAVRAHEDEALWQRLRAGGLAATQRLYSPEAAGARLQPWLEELRARAPRA